jgi:hypothetical protein
VILCADVGWQSVCNEDISTSAHLVSATEIPLSAVIPTTGHYRTCLPEGPCVAFGYPFSEPWALITGGTKATSEIGNCMRYTAGNQRPATLTWRSKKPRADWRLIMGSL